MKRWMLVLGAVVFTLAMVVSVFAEEITVGAGATAAATVLKPIKNPFENATGIQLNIATYGVKSALKELDKGNIDAAMGAHDIAELNELLKKDGYEINPANFQELTIAQPKKYLIVLHKDNPVSKLTKEQVIGIFTGKITNWSVVGGKDMSIWIVWGLLNEASNKHFINTILEDAPITKNILEATNVVNVKQMIEMNPEAIGYLPSAMVSGNIKSPDAPISTTKPINIFTKGKPAPAVQKLIDYIKSGAGQKHIIN